MFSKSQTVFNFILLVIMLMVMFTITAEAGVLSSVKSWVSGELLALVLTAALAILASVNGVLFSKIFKTFKEAGEFLNTLGAALEDKKLSKEEIASIVKEGKDIFAIW